jgi:nicotinamidase-related amidase
VPTREGKDGGLTISNMVSVQGYSSTQGKAALVIVDMQIGLVELIPDEVRTSVLSSISTLLIRARSSGLPVIFIQHDGPEGHPLETRTKGWEIHPSLKPAEGEQVIRKRESDSFFKTPLQQELRKNGITHILIVGGMTEYCVDTTCRRATSLGYDVTLVGDAHLTRDNEVLAAKAIIAHHNFVLNDFGAGEHVIRVKPADQIVF